MSIIGSNCWHHDVHRKRSINKQMFVTIFFSYIKELKNKASQNHMNIGKEDRFKKLKETAI